MKLNAFKAYDIRGKVPEDLNSDLAYKIGRAFVVELNAQSVVVGRDIRLESEDLALALIKGLTEAGTDVLDLGLCGTEEVYFNTFHHHTDGGIMITASHNPKGYNGLKLVSKGSKPISGDTGLKAIEARVINGELGIPATQTGNLTLNTDKTAYIDHLMSYIDLTNLKPLKLVMDVGNGAAGAVIKQIAERLPFDCIFVNETPDGHFPNGVPNPLLPENRATTSKAVKEHNADFGIAWDGDF